MFRSLCYQTCLLEESSNLSVQSDAGSGPDDTLARVSEVSLRMMAGVVSPQKLRELQDLVARSPDVYPWEQVVDSALAEEGDPQLMVQNAVVAQRNWLARGGRETSPAKKGRSVKGHAKRGLAFLIVRSGFLFVFAILGLLGLLLAKHKWPAIDIYRLLDWLREVFPTFFGG